MINLIQSQLADVLRIGLIVALVYTMVRTQAKTGTVLPLAIGVVFVAVILPVTRGTDAKGLPQVVLAGIVANLILLGITLTLAAILQRLRK